ncbi:chaperone protein dnaJ 20, chloroplastic [Manihot esculenta]|uniref:J domain-containing protein n=1 Tax=Manihot esculenta TaxID=3983 RepID=A0A2C9UMA5_MANES|nr:chaperone protein dnaJ 20, chloroplastic [Manihot esculenta]OAY32116.1 hypothetical protein MANES_14G167400v8 [Manihot esculenta]
MDSLLSSSSLRSSTQFLSHQNPNNKNFYGEWAQGFSCRAINKKKQQEEATEKETFYKVLSLNPQEAKPEDIKKAYRKMALRYHPDVCQNSTMSREECRRMFLQVHEAYRTLSDPVLREEYDLGLFLGLTRNLGDNHAGTGSCSWKEQLVELKRRSNLRVAQKEGSWARRVATQNTKMEE